jgi:phage baseplate assembly protein W
MTLVGNSIVDAAIAAELATLEREVPVSTAPLGYGIDIDCVTDVAEDWRETDPESPEGIAQASIRRLTTPRGSLVDEPDYGLDLRAYANRGVAVAELRGIALAAAGEVTKDDRVSSADVELSASLVTRTLDVRIRIMPADPALQEFTLTFAVTSAAVLLETISVTPGV